MTLSFEKDFSICLLFGTSSEVHQFCKVKFTQPSNWLYSVPNLLVFQHLVIMYLGGLVVRVVSEIE